MDDRLQNMKDGDRQAFHDFYFDQHAKLYHYIFRYIRSAWIAEETVQMSFVKLWETREKLSPGYSLTTQLFRIAKSTLIDLLRKNALRKTEPLPEYDIAASPAEHTCPEAKDELKHVLNVIRKMPPAQQKAFSYSRIDDFSHKEIAEKLSISTKTVETHITRAVKHLKKTIHLLFM